MKGNAALFLALHLAAALAAACGCSRKAKVQETTPPKVVKVVEISEGTAMREAIPVQGTLRAKESALVAARIPGSIDEIYVEEGAFVKAGTALFTIDRENLANAVRAAENDLSMAKAKRGEALAALDKAVKDAERMRRLLAKEAVTKDASERAELQLRMAEAADEAAKATVVKAEAGLSVARKNLADSSVKAPFDGTVTKKLNNAGDYALPGKPVFMIENPSVHEISFSVSADRYREIVAGETLVAPSSPSSLAGRRFPVTYKSAAVNPLSRTFEIRAEVPMGDDMVSGMAVDAEIVTREFAAATLPAAAVALLGGEWTAYAVEDGRVVRVKVERGAETDGRVEVKNAAELKGRRIVAEGILIVSEGDRVRESGKE